jgi:uncharacterized protein (DUF1810 family)
VSKDFQEMVADSFDLQRFVDAQRLVYADVTQELARGAKRSHWMWFVFPQLKSLGRSATARHYGIADAKEALAYWQHPVLGARLAECTRLVMSVEGKTALQIFGAPDDLKFRSSMTLFESVAPQEPLFSQALDKYCAGDRDTATLSELSADKLA